MDADHDHATRCVTAGVVLLDERAKLRFESEADLVEGRVAPVGVDLAIRIASIGDVDASIGHVCIPGIIGSYRLDRDGDGGTIKGAAAV